MLHIRLPSPLHAEGPWYATLPIVRCLLGIFPYKIIHYRVVIIILWWENLVCTTFRANCVGQTNSLQSCPTIRRMKIAEPFLPHMQVVRGKTSVSTMPCKCLGVSGTCTVLSCPQQKYSEFSILAKEILRIYLSYTCQFTSTGAAAITTRDRGNGSTGGINDRVSSQIMVSAGQQRSCSQPDERHFLFLDESPNYCVRDVVVGSLGTAERKCDPHTTGPNSCENLCTRCGWGHVNVTQRVEEICYCSFSYCCEIQCHKCLRTQYVSVCA